MGVFKDERKKQAGDIRFVNRHEPLIGLSLACRPFILRLTSLFSSDVRKCFQIYYGIYKTHKDPSRSEDCIFRVWRML